MNQNGVTPGCGGSGHSAPDPVIPDPVTLEVFRHLFASVAEEMGVTLRRTACSANIKERRDYSCALFDGDGSMVAQGENIPVHLGSMPASVGAAIEALRPGPGDVVILNDPYRGGTHLPDITMVAPFFLDDREGTPVAGGESPAPTFYVASRAHHADVGGASPGSMPVARDLIQEGLVIPPVFWTRAGEPVASARSLLLANVRTPEERLGDLAAQEASIDVGLRRLSELVRQRGVDQVLAYALHLQRRAERSMKALLETIPDGTYRFADVVDDDGLGGGPFPIRVEVTIKGGAAVIDFTGTAALAAGGVNAVPAIVHSAVYYAFRCLLPEDVPNNAGLYRPLSVHIPADSLLDPPRGAAVAAGNVETSQRLVDAVLGALSRALPDRIQAASQGTMNNLALGGIDPRTGAAFTFYETSGGGHGGRPEGPGMTARHSHMTNSLNTPVEAMEHDLPVRVERYAVRRESGGDGRHRGGDGLIRVIRLLADAEVTVISERRSSSPYGLHGGRPGRPGRNVLIPVDDSPPLELPAKFTRRLRAGEGLAIETPGGGGWGKK
jgi:N-methylhydantoinase B